MKADKFPVIFSFLQVFILGYENTRYKSSSEKLIKNFVVLGFDKCNSKHWKYICYSEISFQDQHYIRNTKNGLVGTALKKNVSNEFTFLTRFLKVNLSRYVMKSRYFLFLLQL